MPSSVLRSLCSFISRNHPMRKVLLLLPLIYRWGNRGTEFNWSAQGHTGMIWIQAFCWCQTHWGNKYFIWAYFSLRLELIDFVQLGWEPITSKVLFQCKHAFGVIKTLTQCFGTESLSGLGVVWVLPVLFVTVVALCLSVFGYVG